MLSSSSCRNYNLSIVCLTVFKAVQASGVCTAYHPAPPLECALHITCITSGVSIVTRTPGRSYERTANFAEHWSMPVHLESERGQVDYGSSTGVWGSQLLSPVASDPLRQVSPIFHQEHEYKNGIQRSTGPTSPGGTGQAPTVTVQPTLAHRCMALTANVLAIVVNQQRIY